MASFRSLLPLVKVVERVVEVFRLTVSHWVVEVVLLFVAMLKATWLTTVALWALTALSALRTLATLSALWAWTALTLYVSLWFRDEHAVRQLVLACLRVNLKEFHLDLVAFFQTSLFNSFKTLPVYF